MERMRAAGVLYSSYLTVDIFIQCDKLLMMKPRVVIGFLGTTLDLGKAAERWQRWRPTVSLFQHDDLAIDRIELIHARNHNALAELIVRDVAQISPATHVRRHVMDLKDAWDFEEVYGA